MVDGNAVNTGERSPPSTATELSAESLPPSPKALSTNTVLSVTLNSTVPFLREPSGTGISVPPTVRSAIEVAFSTSQERVVSSSGWTSVGAAENDFTVGDAGTSGVGGGDVGQASNAGNTAQTSRCVLFIRVILQKG